MKRRTAFLAVILVLFLAFAASTDTIKDGTITYSDGHYLAGQPLKVGYDIFGYNYQAHLFKGSYANVYLGKDGFPPYGGDDEAYSQRLEDEGFETTPEGKWYWPYRDVSLLMKWNDAWISNRDRDDDGKLDRHHGFDSYIGSGAWETNFQSGSYVDEENGEEINWNYFVKIVAVPADAVKVDDVWYDSGGVEIGPAEWGQFAVVQRVYNDPGEGAHGVEYLSPAAPGFGKYAPAQ